MNSVLTESSAEQPSYPKSWDWEVDGPTAAGTFVRFDSGPTKGYGRKPICVLGVDGEERSVWILETALFGRIRDELAQRRGRTSGRRAGRDSPGEMEKRQDGKREYRATTAYLPGRTGAVFRRALRPRREPVNG